MNGEWEFRLMPDNHNNAYRRISKHLFELMSRIVCFCGIVSYLVEYSLRSGDTYLIEVVQVTAWNWALFGTHFRFKLFKSTHSRYYNNIKKWSTFSSTDVCFKKKISSPLPPSFVHALLLLLSLDAREL